MKVDDVFVVYDNRGEQQRVTVAAIDGPRILTTGGTHSRWVVDGTNLRSARADRYGHYLRAQPAGPWDSRQRINAARKAVQDAMSADSSGELALLLAERVKAHKAVGK